MPPTLLITTPASGVCYTPGMHLIGTLPPGTSDVEIARRAQAAGVETLPLSGLAIAASTPPALLLGYAVLPEAQIVEGVRRLRHVLR